MNQRVIQEIIPDLYPGQVSVVYYGDSAPQTINVRHPGQSRCAIHRDYFKGSNDPYTLFSFKEEGRDVTSKTSWSTEDYVIFALSRVQGRRRVAVWFFQ
jgi:hypothetical protein